MAENPYQAPQTRHEITLAAAWRRHLSLPAIILGVLASLVLLSGLTRSVLILIDLLQSPRMLMYHRELKEFLIWCPLLAAIGPALFLSGLALRRIIRWTYVIAITVGLVLTISVYMIWWYTEMNQVLAQHERDTFGPLSSPVR